MLPVKLVRSLVLGDTIINNPFHHHHHHDYDADADDDDDDDAHVQRRRITITNNTNKKKMPLLLFTPTRELISDTFRLAAIARDIGMDFHPSPSLSHLLFSWHSSSPSPSSSSSSSSHAPFSPSSLSSTSTSTSSSSFLPNDAVPLPFPSLSTASSLSLLRSFVSLSKGLFKLVFLEINPNSGFHSSNYSSSSFSLFSKVSGRRVSSIEDFSRVLAGHGWALFRTREKKNPTSSALSSSLLLSDCVYLFRKKDSNRVRAKGMINGGGGECRIRELRLPALDFKNEVPLRILQYILLMTDDVFYIA